ncbi:MAG: polyhydroxyalkanoate depolymerase [Pseudomonadota bacterium]
MPNLVHSIYDLRQAWLSPLRLTAEAVRQVFTHPVLPLSYTGFGRAMAAGSQWIERTTRHYGKPAFGLADTVIADDKVPVRVVVAAAEGFCELLHFRRACERDDPKLLLVAPLTGHYATMLRDTVAALLPDHDVYVTDWIDAAWVPVSQGRFGLDDCIDYLIRFLGLLGPEAHVIAVGQAVPVLAAAAIVAEGGWEPRSLTLIGAPVDARINPTPVNRLAAQRSLDWFERTAIAAVPAPYPGFMRRVYPGFIPLSGFMHTNLDRHAGSAREHFDRLVHGDGESAAAHRRLYDDFLSVMDVPAELFLDTVKTVFQDHALAEGTMRWRSQRVDPAALVRAALMTVEGELDDNSSPGQTFAAHRLCPRLEAGRRRHLRHPGAGHLALFNGRRWLREVLPQLRAFIRESR